MTSSNDSDSDSEKSEFERLGREKPPALIREFLDFIVHNKKWWLIPILLVLALLAILVVLGQSGAAPFIYPLS